MTCLESTNPALDCRTSNETGMWIISVFQPSGSEIINKKILHISVFSITHKETPRYQEFASKILQLPSHCQYNKTLFPQCSGLKQ